jgi:hypothetical protein
MARAAPTADGGQHISPTPTERKGRTKYDELVDILADGLFEMIVDPSAPFRAPMTRRRRAR